MDSAMVSAAQGLAANSAWLSRIASDIAGTAVNNAAPAASAQSSPAASNNSDLASAFVDKSLALLAYRADARVYETAQAMNRTLLNVTA